MAFRNIIMNEFRKLMSLGNQYTTFYTILFFFFFLRYLGLRTYWSLLTAVTGLPDTGISEVLLNRGTTFIFLCDHFHKNDKCHLLS